MTESRIPMDQTLKMKIEPVRSGVLWGPKIRAQEEAGSMLLETKQECDSLVGAARRKARVLKRKALVNGHRAGLREVAEQLGELTSWRERMLQDQLPQMAHMAGIMAQRIVQRELLQDPETIVGVCRQALLDHSSSSTVTISVCPTDIPRLESARNSLPGENLCIEADKDLSPGECLVSSEAGLSDARFKTKISLLLQSLLGEDHVEL